MLRPLSYETRSQYFPALMDWIVSWIVFIFGEGAPETGSKMKDC